MRSPACTSPGRRPPATCCWDCPAPSKIASTGPAPRGFSFPPPASFPSPDPISHPAFTTRWTLFLRLGSGHKGEVHAFKEQTALLPVVGYFFPRHFPRRFDLFIPRSQTRNPPAERDFLTESASQSVGHHNTTPTSNTTEKPLELDLPPSTHGRPLLSR